ncbi:hypothetical protein RRG08_019733 [Elysia crispata]|uniref:Uncharacterized protein n=1 Tax=Elysia crispata TaxID=231223 RepID=A0AAE0Y650_9GAST|nr:hypothetical protein RRG08_019733 [Elysia crispata]
MRNAETSRGSWRAVFPNQVRAILDNRGEKVKLVCLQACFQPAVVGVITEPGLTLHLSSLLSPGWCSITSDNSSKDCYNNRIIDSPCHVTSTNMASVLQTKDVISSTSQHGGSLRLDPLFSIIAKPSPGGKRRKLLPQTPKPTT